METLLYIFKSKYFSKTILVTAITLSLPIMFNSCKPFEVSDQINSNSQSSELSILEVKALTSSSVQLSWSFDNSENLSFSIFRDNQFMTSTTDTQFVDSNLTENTTYSYIVYAVEIDTGATKSSAEIDVTTLINSTPPPVINTACPNNTQPTENDLVYSSTKSNEFFMNVDFEDNFQANLKGTATDSHCYSGNRALDSRSVTGKAFSTGGSIALPYGVGQGEEVRIRFRVFFPENYKFSSCIQLGLPGCEATESNNSIKFIGINFNVYNQGRHWFNIYHDNAPNDYFWVYEGSQTGFTQISRDPIVKGQWETFEYYTKFTTSDGPSNVRVYKNGKLIHESSSKTINTSSMYMTSLYLLEYWNGGAPADQSAYFDEIIITNKVPKQIDGNGNPYLGL